MGRSEEASIEIERRVGNSVHDHGETERSPGGYRETTSTSKTIPLTIVWPFALYI